MESVIRISSFFGFENLNEIATGLGFGAEKGCPIVFAMMMEYDTIPYISNGVCDSETWPTKNTCVLLKHGLQLNNSLQILEASICILPTEARSPLDFWTRNW